jgi:hypothetical protein
MRTTIRKIVFALSLAGVFFLFSGVGCRVNYSLQGTTISDRVKTVNIPFVPNSSTYVSPTLSTMFTDALRERFDSRTKLEILTDEGVEGDMNIVCEIVGMSATTSGVSADPNYPGAMMRLTVRVRVTYTNKYDPSVNFSQREFSHYSDFDSNIPIQTAEVDHLPVIVETIVDQIFNATAQNW